MEVSTLRDRRLVALFATLVIGGAGAAGSALAEALFQLGNFGSMSRLRMFLQPC